MNSYVQKNKMLIFFVFNMIFTIAMNLAHPVTPALLKDLNLADHVFGIAFAAMSMTNFLFSLVWSNMANGLKKTRIIMVTSIGYALAQLLFMYAQNEWMVYIARLLGGAFAGGFQVGLMTYILQESSGAKQAKYITISSIMLSVGSALGYFVGGMLGDYSVALTFYVQAFVHILIGISVYLILGKYEHQKEETFEWSMIKSSNPFTVLNKSKEYWMGLMKYIFLAILINSMAVTLFDQSFNYYIKDIFNFPPSVNGNIKALVGFFAIVLNYLVIRRRSQQDSKSEYVLPIITAFMAVLSVVVSSVDSSDLFLKISLLWFAFNTMLVPLQQTLVMSFKTDAESGNLLAGLFNSLLMLGKIFGALLASYIYSQQANMTFKISGIMLLIALLFVIVQLIKDKKTP